MTIVEITGGMLRAGRAPVGLSLEDLAGSRESRRQQSCQWRGVPSAKVLRWCAARLLLRTLTDEFAFRRISRIDVRVLPIQIEHRWQDIAASTPRPPRATLGGAVWRRQIAPYARCSHRLAYGPGLSLSPPDTLTDHRPFDTLQSGPGWRWIQCNSIN